MKTLRIFAIVRQFYFNYNYTDSDLPYVHSLFSRRVKYAIQVLISFLAGGFLAYGTSLKTQTPQPFLILVITVLCIQDTVGLTIAATFQTLLALTPTTLFIFIVQKIGLGYHDYIATEFILLISAFFIGFVTSQAQLRKLPLVICAIFFSTIVNQPNVPSTFIFLLLEEIVIGLCICLLVSLVIFPSFATIEIENRVHYALLNLDKMHSIIVQSFLHEDEINAQALLTRASTIERMIREAIGPIQKKLMFARLEPTKLLQLIFNLKRRKLFHLTLNEQNQLITSMFLHVRSMQSMVKQCRFNEYHTSVTRNVRKNLEHLCSQQSTIINNIAKSSSITKDEFMQYIAGFNHANQELTTAYRNSNLYRLEYTILSDSTIQSEDYLSHTFFIFHVHAIALLLIEAVTRTKQQKIVEKPKKKSLKKRLIPKWSRVQVAIKTAVIIGIGSVFILEPTLVRTFENGQWIFTALCMTQGDAVGGAFITMRMRLFGTLLGAMWAYITFLAVGEDIYNTLGMLVPWVLFFGYVKSFPNWTYTAIVAIFTPIMINLGRLAYTTPVPEENFVFLRIEENLIGIGVAFVLTLIIFPVFNIDTLKKNIQRTLQNFCESVILIRSIYNKLVHVDNPTQATINIDESNDIGSFFAAQRDNFYQFIIIQRADIENIRVEPTFIWVNNFSPDHYTKLIEQEIDICRILHSIDASLIRINESWSINEKEMYLIGNEFFLRFRKELLILSTHLSRYYDLWATYFKLGRSRYHLLFNDGIYHDNKLSKIELLKVDPYLAELHLAIKSLQNQHQDDINQILKGFLDRFGRGHTPSSFLLYGKNNQNHLMLIAVSTLYYSTIQLIRQSIDLGTTVHNIFELETTNLYTRF